MYVNYWLNHMDRRLGHLELGGNEERRSANSLSLNTTLLYCLAHAHTGSLPSLIMAVLILVIFIANH